MKASATDGLKPRKQPIQSRSGVTVEAIHEATIQVLLAEDLGRFTTTRVADRAGVSVGTLYQYFPNKEALLYAILLNHFEAMATEFERIASNAENAPLSDLAASIADAYVSVKMRNPEATKAMYRIAGAINQVRLSSDVFARMGRAVGEILGKANDASFADPKTATFTVLAALAGLARGSFGELGEDHGVLDNLRIESRRLAIAYLHAAASAGKNA
ncbi:MULTISPECIES: TetR/AcrR family transcriptional regulator [Thalassospira]|uniref:TetR/AcrR family transcriptional regulator n=1 Tax=Thalassospira aquimaris TaxID=3037796 RepID=A0ABT6G8A3_9PROT|nr:MULTISPECIES: TetR/AcrR family transcriptional regulator [Thalassospira]MDG4718233.1 TetR/AcrR family transcriptional regulator [Thalassospira sp. FZY0004]